MLATGKAIVLPVILSAALAASAAAQAPSCTVDEGSPSPVAKAFLSVTQAANAQQAEKWADAAMQLRSAVKSLTEKPEAIKNELGRTFVLGKALSLWMNQPDQPAVAPAASLGFVQGADRQIDLVVAVDSLFGTVERAQPACVALTADWRRQKAWVALLNSAIEQANAGRLDSAEVVARRSLLLNKSPYAFMVLGNVAQNRQQVPQALDYYRQTVEAATDSVYKDIRDQTLVLMGGLAADAAESAEGAEKTRLAREAASAYQRVVTESPGSLVAPQARAGLSRSLLLQGDTTAFRASLKEHLENPAAYTYHDILASAVSAARASQWAEASKLFDNTLTLNPWNRDALFNAALANHELKQYQAMLPYLAKLVQVDPGNGENWRLYAYAYNGLAKATKVPAQVKALNDSVVKYFEMAEKLPHQVVFSEFTNGPTRTSLGGSIENRGTAEKSYVMKVEFLDKSGAVVATREAPVGPVAPKARGQFSVAVENTPAIVAFRYAPLR